MIGKDARTLDNRVGSLTIQVSRATCSIQAREAELPRAFVIRIIKTLLDEVETAVNAWTTLYTIECLTKLFGGLLGGAIGTDLREWDVRAIAPVLANRGGGSVKYHPDF